MRYLSARAGGAAKAGKPEAIAESRRDLAAERIACYIERVVAAAPPLTAEQQTRLAALLRPGAA
ncbi:MAG: hypothetical protein ACR2JO_09945 [Mycobacteriales bacterium]